MKRKSKKKTRQTQQQPDDYALSGGRYPMHDIAHALFSHRKVEGKPEEKQVRTAILARWPDLLKPKGGGRRGRKDQARGVQGRSPKRSEGGRSVAGQRGGHNRGKRKEGKPGSGSAKPKASSGKRGATETA